MGLTHSGSLARLVNRINNRTSLHNNSDIDHKQTGNNGLGGAGVGVNQKHVKLVWPGVYKHFFSLFVKKKKKNNNNIITHVH